MSRRVLRPSSTRPGRLLGAVAAATTLMLLIGMGTANGQPVPVDDEPVTVTVPLISPPEQNNVIVIDPVTYSFTVTTQTVQSEISSGCHSTEPSSASTVSGTLCIGNIGGGSTPINVLGMSDVAGLFKQAGAAAALGWMVEEGIAYVRAVYDVPDDARVEQYARPQLRSYVVTRLLGIMKKAHDGVSLSENETRALAFLRQQVRADDIALTSATAAEYRAFEANPCGYSPPAAPAGVTDPVRKPAAVVKDCSRPHSALETLFGFLPPKPSVAEFKAWGAYKTASSTSLGLLTNATYQESIRGLAVGLTAGAGLAVALGAAGIAAAVVGSSATLAATVGAITGTYAATAIFAAKLGAAAPAILGGVAAASAAAVVGIVIFAAVMIAVSIWMLVENESIGTQILSEADKARSAADPLDIAGSELYQSEEFITRLVGKVADWTTIDDGRTAIADSYRAVSPDEQIVTDFSFTRAEVNGTSVGTPQPVDSITVQQPGRTVDLHFNQDWLIAKESTRGNAYPVLSFGYTGTDGKQHVASRAPRSKGGFIVSTPSGTNVTGVRQDTIEMVEPGTGKKVRIGIKPPSSWLAVGPRPSAGGAMFTHRTVFFRPNPVDASGSFDFDAAQTDYDYAWTLWRKDEVSEQWSPVTMTGAATYGPSFVPTRTGVYEARVAMTRKAPGSPTTNGSVRFTVGAPPIQVVDLALLDNGYDELEVDAKLASPTMSDSYQVEVRWPGTLDGTPGPTSTKTLECLQTAPASCETVRTSDFSALRLRQAIDNDTDLSQPVTVTITGSQGTTLTRSFAIDDPIRPSATPPTEGDNAGARGSVSVEQGITQVEVPVGTTSYANYVVARLDDGGDFPGTGFGLIDPATGVQQSAVDVFGDGSFVARAYEDPSDHIWKLVLSGIPYPSRVGVREVPLIIRQGLSQTLIRLRVGVVPATQDRYRGVILSDVDPLDFAVDQVPELEPTVLGGRSEWGSWTGDICVDLEFTGGGPPPDYPAYCAPASSFHNADGTPKDFPWQRFKPDGLGTGTYRVMSWLPDDPRTDGEPIGTSFLLTKGAVVAGSPAVLGARVGGIASVAPGAWSTTPDISFAYQWLRDGAEITGATRPTYQPKPGDAGHRLSVRMTGSVPGWTSATTTSSPVVVGLGTLPVKPKPKAAGTAKIGKRLTVKPGSWGSGVTLAYRWYLGGKAVKAKKGAKASLKLTRKMRGKKVYVVVTATRPGYAPVAVRSAAKKVR